MKNFNLPQAYKAVMYNLFGNPADIKMPIDTEYNIDQIAEAVTMAESEGRNGKILLNFELNTSSDTAEKCMYYCW
ncbi:MAG: hypothetical protein LBE72_03070 [Rickettsia sp.]|jgi:hypothetical protein|nr:hypothetical protein [Rickettsia sp.]